MTAQLEADKHFHFQRVEIFKSNSLGIGSYGAVYRARCDQLPCAAKLLHVTLFQTGDPGSQRILQRFEQECQFLSGIRHPHIVQYLGMCRDPESGLPVLLMELMDDSLTHFLEESRERLPYHLEVDLCHDIALAIVYLHSNGIIHRDLSSNNVLLIAGSRAKVTDFGMSKLLETTPHATQCPGTMVYMSPEALRSPPTYMEKLDCFSFGVLGIQIMTRQFPNPGPARQFVEDQRYPIGRIEVPIPDSERRKTDIGLINLTHPLLPLALNCLKYSEDERPSAQDLCHHLATLKEAPCYSQSKQQGQHDQEVRDLQQQLQAMGQEIDQLLQDKDRQIQDKDRQLQDKDRQLQDKDRQLQDRDRQLQDRDRQLQDRDHNVIEAKDRELQELNDRLQVSQDSTVIDALQQSLFTKTGDLSKEKQPGIRQPLHPQDRTEAVGSMKLNWARCEEAPLWAVRGSATVDGSMAYFGPRLSAYDSNTKEWHVLPLPEFPYHNFSLAVVQGVLTTIGGRTSDGSPTNCLLSLSGKKWSKRFPPMPTKRCGTVAVSTERSLVVAGGRGHMLRLSTVEILNMESLKWTRAKSLPCPLEKMSATICGDELYLMGGYEDGIVTRSVFTCSMVSLLESCQPQQEALQVWHKIADVPAFRTTCTTLCEQLIAVGGDDSMGWCNPTTAIHVYNQVHDSWSVISEMPTARYDCLVAVLPGNILMVVGGDIGRRACGVVEVATVV